MVDKQINATNNDEILQNRRVHMFHGVHGFMRKKSQYDLQFAQTNQDYIARHFAADAIKRDVKATSLYDGILNEPKINSSIVDQYCRDVVVKTLRRKWKTDASGNFVSGSKSIIGMKIDYYKPNLGIQFDFYENQKSFDEVAPLGCGSSLLQY